MKKLLFLSFIVTLCSAVHRPAQHKKPQPKRTLSTAQPVSILPAIHAQDPQALQRLVLLVIIAELIKGASIQIH